MINTINDLILNTLSLVQTPLPPFFERLLNSVESISYSICLNVCDLRLMCSFEVEEVSIYPATKASPLKMPKEKYF